MFRGTDFPLGYVLWWTIAFAIVGFATTLVATGWAIGYMLSCVMG